MGTPFKDVVDMALITIQDYKIDKLYNNCKSQWIKYLSGFVVKAIPHFDCSRIDLDFDISTLSFKNDLGYREIMILANWAVYEWFTREVQNVSQFNLTMTPSDFKRYAESQNLKEKSEYKDKLREIATQAMTVYSLHSKSLKDMVGF